MEMHYKASAVLKSIVVMTFLTLCSTMLAGCSSLGLSLYPAGSFLTEQAEQVLDQSPRHVSLPRELDLGVLQSHHLQPGDVLLLEPVDLASDLRLPADQKVLVDGTLDLAEFGRLVVAGMTVEDAEQLIQNTIHNQVQKRQGEGLDAGSDKAGNQEPDLRVNVRLLEPIHHYYVLGEVNSPGSYSLEGHETVLDGILRAGGLTGAASPCKVLLARPTTPSSCRVTLPICYREITQLGDTETNYQLMPGDRIFVSSRSFCEDLRFWDATKTCDRCCKCQTACPDPSFGISTNPMQRVVNGPVASGAHAQAFLGNDPVRASRGNDQVIQRVPVPASIEAHSVIDAGVNPASGQSSGTQTAAGMIDGELDLETSIGSLIESSSERFEPLWINPADSE